MENIRIVGIGKMSDQNRIGYRLNMITDSSQKKTLNQIWFIDSKNTFWNLPEKNLGGQEEFHIWRRENLWF